MLCSYCNTTQPFSRMAHVAVAIFYRVIHLLQPFYLAIIFERVSVSRPYTFNFLVQIAYTKIYIYFFYVHYNGTIAIELDVIYGMF